MTVKRELIWKPAAESIRSSGGRKDPAKYKGILMTAVTIITEMCRILRREGRETWAEAWGDALTKLMDLVRESLTGRTGNIKKDTRARTIER